MDRLRRNEWREVKDRAAAITFHCDLLGRLPIEIVTSIAEYLHLSEIISLRRVSHRWRHVLSSPSVYLPAIWATLGENLPISDPTQVMKRRLRLERGTPSHTICLLTRLKHSGRTPGVGYANGIYVWPENDTSLAMLNLWTGRLVKLMTENRECLTMVRLSKEIVAAISTRGQCHVWNINTEEHKDFRLPSLEYHHFLVNGLKIALSYRGYMVHWGFDTESTRTVQIGPNPVTLALHPIEDQFTLICLRETESDDRSEQEGGYFPWTTPPICSRMHTQKFVLDATNEFTPATSFLQKLPLGYECVIPGSSSDEVWPGQSSVLVNPTPGERGPTFYLNLNSSNEIVVHTMPELSETCNFICPGKGLIYTGMDSEDCLVIMKSNESVPLSASIQPRMSWSDNTIERKKSYWNCSKMLGDSDFILMFGVNSLEIWSFNDNWDVSLIRSVLEK